jgi:energy-coupling factor transporter transmembrane protein EcfT
LGQDAFGSLQAANQSLKTFKERCEICWCPFFGICFLRDDWVYLLIIVIICYLLIICWLFVDYLLMFAWYLLILSIFSHWFCTCLVGCDSFRGIVEMLLDVWFETVLCGDCWEIFAGIVGELLPIWILKVSIVDGVEVTSRAL